MAAATLLGGIPFHQETTLSTILEIDSAPNSASWCSSSPMPTWKADRETDGDGQGSTNPLAAALERCDGTLSAFDRETDDDGPTLLGSTSPLEAALVKFEGTLDVSDRETDDDGLFFLRRTSPLEAALTKVDGSLSAADRESDADGQTLLGSTSPLEAALEKVDSTLNAADRETDADGQTLLGSTSPLEAALEEFDGSLSAADDLEAECDLQALLLGSTSPLEAALEEIDGSFSPASCNGPVQFAWSWPLARQRSCSSKPAKTIEHLAEAVRPAVLPSMLEWGLEVDGTLEVDDDEVPLLVMKKRGLEVFCPGVGKILLPGPRDAAHCFDSELSMAEVWSGGSMTSMSSGHELDEPLLWVR